MTICTGFLNRVEQALIYFVCFSSGKEYCWCSNSHKEESSHKHHGSSNSGSKLYSHTDSHCGNSHSICTGTSCFYEEKETNRYIAHIAYFTQWWMRERILLKQTHQRRVQKHMWRLMPLWLEIITNKIRLPENSRAGPSKVSPPKADLWSKAEIKRYSSIHYLWGNCEIQERTLAIMTLATWLFWCWVAAADTIDLDGTEARGSWDPWLEMEAWTKHLWIRTNFWRQLLLLLRIRCPF